MEEEKKEKRPNQQNRKKGRKCSGVLTCYLGDSKSPTMQALEAYCITNELTVSEAMRNVVKAFLKDKGFLEK